MLFRSRRKLRQKTDRKPGEQDHDVSIASEPPETAEVWSRLWEKATAALRVYVQGEHWATSSVRGSWHDVDETRHEDILDRDCLLAGETKGLITELERVATQTGDTSSSPAGSGRSKAEVRSPRIDIPLNRTLFPHELVQTLDAMTSRRQAATPLPVSAQTGIHSILVEEIRVNHERVRQLKKTPSSSSFRPLESAIEHGRRFMTTLESTLSTTTERRAGANVSDAQETGKHDLAQDRRRELSNTRESLEIAIESANESESDAIASDSSEHHGGFLGVNDIPERVTGEWPRW